MGELKGHWQGFGKSKHITEQIWLQQSLADQMRLYGYVPLDRAISSVILTLFMFVQENCEVWFVSQGQTETKYGYV